MRSARGLKISNDAVGAFATAQGHGDDGADALRIAGRLAGEAGILLGLRDDQGFAVLGNPAGHAFADLDAQAAQRFVLSAGGNGVVELLRGFVEHEQGPQLRLDGALHVLEDGAQNGVQVEARGERASQLVEDEQIGERDTIFRLVLHHRPCGGRLETFCHIGQRAR